MDVNSTPGANISGLSVLDRYPSHNAIVQEFAPIGPLVEKIVPPIWYFIGFIGNQMCMIIWLGQRMRRNNSSAIYLGALAISDSLFLLFHLLYTLHVAWGYDIYNHYVACEVFHFFFYIPQYMSTFLVLGFTAERYVAVCHPFLKERWCTVPLAIICVFILLVVSMALASAQTYIWTYNLLHKACNIRPAASEGKDYSFWNIWTWVSDMFAFGLVPLLVLIFNILVLKEIYKISKNDVLKRQQGRKGGNNTASTLTLLSVSFYLIITQVTATVVANLQNAFPTGEFLMTDEEIRRDPTWTNLFNYLQIRKVIEVICLSHYACYFFIYCFTGKHFRKEVIYLISFHGRLSFLTNVSKKRRGERYSMVSSNGLAVSETYATNMSTTM